MPFSSSNKVNKIDFRWHVVRTLPHQEKVFYDLLMASLAAHQGMADNILEAYCPTHTTVKGVREGKDVRVPLFGGYVFVLSTQQALADFLRHRYPGGDILCTRNSGKYGVLTIPESQMRFFMEFNDNYLDHVILLERPYADYAFNPKTNQPNEVVKVIDGPLAGRVGYLTRFRGERRMVFRMRDFDGRDDLAVSIPNVWDFHVVRVCNVEDDRVAVATAKDRAADLLIGILQGLGYGDDTLPMFHNLIRHLALKPSLIELGKELRKRHALLAQSLLALDTEDVRLVLNLVRYESDFPGYVCSRYQQLVIRPFLTPTSGIPLKEGTEEARLSHTHFTEIIRKVTITEPTFCPKTGEEQPLSTTYYAHIGKLTAADGSTTYFANWQPLLSPYYHTVGAANKKLVAGKTDTKEILTAKVEEAKLMDSFLNYGPTLYRILTGQSPVRAKQSFKVGDNLLDVLCLEYSHAETDADLFLQTCIDICRELNSTTHLAVWRRYLCEIWLRH